MANPLAFLANPAGSLGGDLLNTAASIWQADKQEDFQAKYSNTAYQRAAQDLSAAGLNRVLALGSPASTPSGAQANLPQLGDALRAATDVNTRVSSAKSAIGLQTLQGELVKSQKLQADSAATLNAANSAKAAAEARNSQLQGDRLQWQNKWIKAGAPLLIV